MSADICTCPPLGAFEGPYLKNPSCPVHGNTYKDRRGRIWEKCKVTECQEPGEWWNYRDMARQEGRHLTPAQMRLLIERDQHRATCPGLWNCRDHPVPTVTLSRMFKPRVYVDDLGVLMTLPEAMDAARALAVRDV